MSSEKTGKEKTAGDKFDTKFVTVQDDDNYLGIGLDYDDDPTKLYPVLLCGRGTGHLHIHMTDEGCDKLIDWLVEWRNSNVGLQDT